MLTEQGINDMRFEVEEKQKWLDGLRDIERSIEMIQDAEEDDTDVEIKVECYSVPISTKLSDKTTKALLKLLKEEKENYIKSYKEESYD